MLAVCHYRSKEFLERAAIRSATLLLIPPQHGGVNNSRLSIPMDGFSWSPKSLRATY